MFWYLLLWLAVFLDVLDSFTPPRNVLPTLTATNIFATTTTTSQTTSDGMEIDTNMTFTLPRFAASEEDYPSRLHKIHVKPLMSEEESKICFNLAVTYAASTGRWDAPDFNRHSAYATCDFPVQDCEELENYLQEIDFDGRLWEQLSHLYDVDYEDLSYLDLFVAHYQAANNDDDEEEEGKNKNVMDRLEAHRDGTILSFSMLLNSPDDFTGGGTFYDALRDVEPVGVLHKGGIIRPNKAGEAVLHCGKVLHGADVVTSGSRTVLVGFVDVADRCIRPGALAEACTDFGRMDVAMYRFKRQLSKGHRGWVLNNDKWLRGSSSSSSRIKGFVPAFSSVIRRAEPEYQRLQKLESEDILLRQVLLPREERPEDEYGGDFTIVS